MCAPKSGPQWVCFGADTSVRPYRVVMVEGGHVGAPPFEFDWHGPEGTVAWGRHAEQSY